MSKPYRMHIRLGDKDGDLILLGSWYRITEMVRHAIHYYLGQTDEKISLPPYSEEIPKEAIYTALFYPEKDSEEIEFLESIPNGFRSTVVKRLLRHAMEKCDLRPILKKAPKLSKGKKEEPADESENILAEEPKTSAAVFCITNIPEGANNFEMNLSMKISKNGGQNGSQTP